MEIECDVSVVSCVRYGAAAWACVERRDRSILGTAATVASRDYLKCDIVIVHQMGRRLNLIVM